MTRTRTAGFASTRRLSRVLPLFPLCLALLFIATPAPTFVQPTSAQLMLPAGESENADNDSQGTNETTAVEEAGGPLGLTSQTDPAAVLDAEIAARDGSLKIEKPELDSPRAAMAAFLRGMELVNRGYDEGYRLVYPTLADPDREPPVENLRDAAERLLGVLNRIERVDVLELPGEAELRQMQQEHGEKLPRRRWQYFPQRGRNAVFEKLSGKAPDGKIVLAVGDDGQWRFTPGTVQRIEALYDSVAALPPVHSDPALAPSGQLITIIGPTFERTPLWAWGGLLGLIFAGLAGGKLLQTAFTARASRHRRKNQEIPAVFIESFSSPISLLCITLGLNFGLQLIEMDPRLLAFANSVLTLLYITAAGWLLYNLVDVIGLLLRRGAERTRSKLDDQVAPLVRKSLRIFLVVLLSLMVAQNVFGLNITGWIAGLGIVGLAISLAAQDSVRNLFGSITVLFDKPFAVGDWIKVGDVEGTVEEVGFRSTRIRTFYNSQITY
ncbi:MAG: mechanosensitive ion channel family protein, partial [Phycisphaeraceae bacterium]